jgi:hypothetical protein
MQLFSQEKIVNAIFNGVVATLRCSECEELAIRLVLVCHDALITLPDEFKRKIPLCPEHFIEACIQFPELRLICGKKQLDSEDCLQPERSFVAAT